MSRQRFFIFEADTMAFEEVCGALHLTKGEPPAAFAAESIFKLAKEGERDAALLASRVILPGSEPRVEGFRPHAPVFRRARRDSVSRRTVGAGGAFRLAQSARRLPSTLWTYH
jgi:hypothetical protein